MSDIDNLKRSAAPNSERIALAVEESRDLLKEIRDYKEQQKQGDIRSSRRAESSRRRAEVYSKIGLGISLVAVYISITGLDGTGVRFVISLFEGLL